MSFKIADFVKYGLQEDINIKRSEIRAMKKEIKWLENAIQESAKISETQYKELLKEDKRMLEKYEKMKAMVEEKGKKELTKMIKEGKLREVLLDEDGKVIETENTDSEQPQLAANDPISGGQDAPSGGDNQGA